MSTHAQPETRPGSPSLITVRTPHPGAASIHRLACLLIKKILENTLQNARVAQGFFLPETCKLILFGLHLNNDSAEAVAVDLQDVPKLDHITIVVEASKGFPPDLGLMYKLEAIATCEDSANRPISDGNQVLRRTVGVVFWKKTGLPQAGWNSMGWNTVLELLISFGKISYNRFGEPRTRLEGGLQPALLAAVFSSDDYAAWSTVRSDFRASR